MRPPLGRARALLVLLTGLLLLGSLTFLAVLALGGERLVGVHLFPSVHVRTHDIRWWLILALVAALVSLIGWAAAERARARLARSGEALESSAREAEAGREEAEQRQQRAEERLAESEQEREQEHERQERYEDAWRAQREWNHRLREQVSELQRRQGVLGRLNVHDMILQLTVELVGAEKGILLSGSDDSEERLEVVSAVGFEHDPSDSAIARRFAKEVMERDRTIREDHPAKDQHGARTAADEEVQNLLAIPLYLRDDFHGVIVCANREGGFDSLDDEVLMAVGDHAGAVLQNSRLHGELRNAYLQTVRTLSSVIEVKDPDLRGHSDAVAEYVMSVADKLGFEPHKREELVFGAMLHDVGKIGISERILLKPAALTDEERSVMRLHPRIGYHLIRQIPALESVAPAVLHHHERYDGDGYPSQLRGEAIPMEARIIAVADAFSAMTTERPYRDPVSVEDACVELERCAGAQFDPQVVKLFVAEVRRRPPDELVKDPAPPDPELEVHRDASSFVLGGSSFGIVDSLTLLYSHRHFYESAHAEAQRASMQGRPFAVVVIRLDELGTVNREQGYAAGDELLRSVADVFRRAAGALGGVAFRVSGRRIGLIAPNLGQAAAEDVAGQISEELEVAQSGAVGVAAWRPDESAEQVVERALRGEQGIESALRS